MLGGERPRLPLDALFVDDFDFELGALRLWVHGRERPDETDGGHDDWLFVTARYDCLGASVWTCGPIVLTCQLPDLLRDLEAMDGGLCGEAKFASLEGVLAFSLEMNKFGRIAFHVFITPDNESQRHDFDATLDQSYLLKAIRGLRNVIHDFPITS